MPVSDFIYSRLLSHFPFEPTGDQKVLFNTLAHFISGEIPGEGECGSTGTSASDTLVVNGYAGTGKTSAMAAFVATLKEFERKFKLMAPTGRAAKVLANYTHEKSSTIHKQIYRQKDMEGGIGEFNINISKDSETIFIVDEASLISIDSFDSHFGSGDLLGDLISYIRQRPGNKLILVGDDAQLPPVSMDKSPALDLSYLTQYDCYPTAVTLSDVVRQASESGILYNATLIRHAICHEDLSGIPKLLVKPFDDISMINGGELIESLEDAIGKYGLDETVVLCRSNKRANRYNAGIRASVLLREERLTRGEKLMVVKNCYQFLSDIPELDFIANGDVASLMKISHYEERYGLHFAEAVLSFPDYNDIEITAKVILDTLESESASLSKEQSSALWEGVLADYSDLPTKKKRYDAVREDRYFNALQIKYATAITCHKSQGGQWPCVFIDNPFWHDDITLDDLKWLYTAITRAVSRVYLVNFPPESKR